jgi:hypothetical protein
VDNTVEIDQIGEQDRQSPDLTGVTTPSGRQP